MFVGWLRHVDDRFDSICVWSPAILGNDVAHVCHCCHLELNLPGVEHDILSVCTFQNVVHDRVMLDLISRCSDEVISNDVHALDVGTRFFIELMPNGIHSNRFRPHGVWDVQRYDDFSDSLTCQYQSFVWITVMIFMPLSRLCTSDGVGTSALLSGCGSRHTRVGQL